MSDQQFVERYGFLDEIQPGMAVWVDGYGLKKSGWLIVTGRRDSESPNINLGGALLQATTYHHHINLVGQFDEDGSPGRTEGKSTNSILIREFADA